MRGSSARPAARANATAWAWARSASARVAGLGQRHRRLEHLEQDQPARIERERPADRAPVGRVDERAEERGAVEADERGAGRPSIEAGGGGRRVVGAPVEHVGLGAQDAGVERERSNQRAALRGGGGREPAVEDGVAQRVEPSVRRVGAPPRVVAGPERLDRVRQREPLRLGHTTGHLGHVQQRHVDDGHVGPPPLDTLNDTHRDRVRVAVRQHDGVRREVRQRPPRVRHLRRRPEAEPSERVERAVGSGRVAAPRGLGPDRDPGVAVVGVAGDGAAEVDPSRVGRGTRPVEKLRVQGVGQDEVGVGVAGVLGQHAAR